MSKYTMEKIKCPQCERSSDFIIWQSIDTVLNPEMKKLVRTGEAFQYTCPHCKTKKEMDYSFLYHQLEDKMMIYCVTDRENYDKVYAWFTGADTQEICKNLLYKDYLIRIVSSLNSLWEKLEIFDAGLDDRVIEIAKPIFIEKAQEQGIGVNRLCFYVDDYNGYSFILYRGNEKIGTMGISQKSYDTIKKDFLSNAPDIRKDRMDIDRNWALQIMKGNEKK